MVAQGFSPRVETYKYGNPDARRGGILSRRSTQCEDGNAHASICSIALCHPTIRWGSVCFFAFPTGFVRVAHSTRGYFMPPRHAARLLNSACRVGRLARPEARGRQPAELSTSSIGIRPSYLYKFQFITLLHTNLAF